MPPAATCPGRSCRATPSGLARLGCQRSPGGRLRLPEGWYATGYHGPSGGRVFPRASMPQAAKFRP
eukprot:7975204-Alexandrium_andersonii.AAC.1